MSLTLLDSYIVSMRFKRHFYPARTLWYECIAKNSISSINFTTNQSKKARLHHGRRPVGVSTKGI
jgi:hypothetical protein